MLRETAADERRLFRRYSMDAPVLVTGENLVGLIKDLSCCGCSFQLIKKRHERESLPGIIYSLCLEPLGMAKVQVRTVQDLPACEPVDSLAGTVHLRRVKFTGLNLVQMLGLQQYIRKNCMVAGGDVQ